LFGVPGAAGIALKEAGYSIVTISGVTGAMGSVGYRGVQDVAAGQFSGIQYYVFDATTGALIGVFVGGVSAKFAAPKPTGTGKPSELYHHFQSAKTVDDILESGAVLGQNGRPRVRRSNGRIDTVYKMRMGLTPGLAGRVRFKGQVAGMFEPHPVEGWHSGMKRAAGQWVSKRPGYDIKFDPLTAGQSRIIQNETEQLLQRTLTISRAEWAKQSAGRFLWSHTRLWVRRVLIDWGIPALGAGAGLYFQTDEEKRRSVFSPWSLGLGNEPGIGYGPQSLLDVPAESGMPGTFGGLPKAPIIHVVPTSKAGGAGAFYLPQQSDIPVVIPNRPATTLLPAADPGASNTGEVRLYIEQGESVPVPQWGSSQQNEWVIVDENLPPGSLTGTISLSRVPALTLDEEGRLVQSQKGFDDARNIEQTDTPLDPNRRPATLRIPSLGTPGPHHLARAGASLDRRARLGGRDHVGACGSGGSDFLRSRDADQDRNRRGEAGLLSPHDFRAGRRGRFSVAG
jgi:hypothetical protein